MKAATGRLVLVQMTAAAALLALLPFLGTDAEAVSVKGDWISAVPGEGFVQESAPADFHYDVLLKLDAGGSGTIRLTCRKVDEKWPGWVNPSEVIGQVDTYGVTGSFPGGDKFSMTFSGVTFGPLTVGGGKMHGQGQYSAGGTTYGYKFNLKGGDPPVIGDPAVTSAALAASGLGGAAALGASMAARPGALSRAGARPAGTPTPQAGPYRAPSAPGAVRDPPGSWGTPARGPIYGGPPARQYTVSPGDARPYQPEPFAPPAPDPNLTRVEPGLAMVMQGPPDKPPPPNPPRGDERPDDRYNPSCRFCGRKTLPAPDPRLPGRFSWYCPGCTRYPWMEP